MKSLSSVHFAAIGLILLSLLINYAYYYNTDSLKSPIIEYEFVKNQQDVKNIFTENNEFKKNEIRGVRDQNIVDYFYMIFYTSLIILAINKIKKIENKKLYGIGIAFSIIALFSDIFENIQMFQISELLVNRINFSEHVKLLFIITRLKWLSLAFVMLILSFHYSKHGIIGKLFALLSALPLISVITFIIFKDSGNDFIKIFTNFITLSFVVLMIWIFISNKINKKVNFYKPINTN